MKRTLADTPGHPYRHFKCTLLKLLGLAVKRPVNLTSICFSVFVPSLLYVMIFAKKSYNAVTQVTCVQECRLCRTIKGEFLLVFLSLYSFLYGLGLWPNVAADILRFFNISLVERYCNVGQNYFLIKIGSLTDTTFVSRCFRA